MFEISSITRFVFLAALFSVGLILEHMRPLRIATQPKFTRVSRNLFIAAISGVAMQFMFFPFVIWATDFSSTHKLGLLNNIQLNWPLKFIVSILALDYTLYFWHKLNHKLPFLWRFHNVHHIDLDLDVSTASRFHFGELINSTFFRILQIFIFGIDLPSLILFEISVTAFAQFHHSNVCLPIGLERILNLIIVTPRMHGIHHSIIKDETDSSYGTIFTIWDRFHHSLRLGIKQNEISIGVPSYRTIRDQTIFHSLFMPFFRQRDWQLPNGKIPNREKALSRDLLP